MLACTTMHGIYHQHRRCDSFVRTLRTPYKLLWHDNHNVYLDYPITFRQLSHALTLNYTVLPAHPQRFTYPHSARLMFGRPYNFHTESRVWQARLIAYVASIGKHGQCSQHLLMHPLRPTGQKHLQRLLKRASFRAPSATSEYLSSHGQCKSDIKKLPIHIHVCIPTGSVSVHSLQEKHLLTYFYNVQSW